MFGKFLKGIAGMFGEVVLDDIKLRVDDAMDEAKERVQEITEQVIKRIISLFLILVGVIFGLVGLSKFLSENVVFLDDGVGYIVVGLVLVIIAWIAKSAADKQKKD